MGDETQAFIDSISNLPNDAYILSIRPDETIYHIPYLIVKINPKYRDRVFGWNDYHVDGVEIQEIVENIHRDLWFETYLHNADYGGMSTYEIAVSREVFEKARRLIKRTKGIRTKITNYTKSS